MSSHPQASASSWSRQEFAGLDLGDTRLNDRLVGIADAIAAQPNPQRHTPHKKLVGNSKHRSWGIKMTRDW